jgi:hypothetical protein
MYGKRQNDSCSDQYAGRIENYFYLERAKYFQQIKRYLDIFGHNNVKVIIFERFFSDAELNIRDVFCFLGVQQNFVPEIKVVNKGGRIKFHWLKNLRNKKYPFLRSMLPIKLRKNIRIFIRDINTYAQGDVRSEIGKNGRAKFKKFVENDVLNLKSILDDKIIEWDDFN